MKRVDYIKRELCQIITSCKDKEIKDLLSDLYKIPLFQDTIDSFIKSINEVRVMEWLYEDLEK